MCKADKTTAAKVNQLVKLRSKLDALQAEIDALTDEIKSYMGDDESMEAGMFKITYKPVTQSRLDTNALKKTYGTALEPFYKVTTSRPFKITC